MILGGILFFLLFLFLFIFYEQIEIIKLKNFGRNFMRKNKIDLQENLKSDLTQIELPPRTNVYLYRKDMESLIPTLMANTIEKEAHPKFLHFPGFRQFISSAKQKSKVFRDSEYHYLFISPNENSNSDFLVMVRKSTTIQSIINRKIKT